MEPETKTCPVCKFPVVREEPYDMAPYTRCSEFCASASDKELTEFKAAQPGWWCVYPCPECGCPTEGDWYPDEPRKTICGECGPKVRLRERTKLLEEALPHLPPELRAQVEEALKR